MQHKLNLFLKKSKKYTLSKKLKKINKSCNNNYLNAIRGFFNALEFEIYFLNWLNPDIPRQKVLFS